MKWAILFLILVSYQVQAVDDLNNDFEKFTETLIGKDLNPVHQEYNQIIANYSHNFDKNFIEPISLFTKNNLSTNKKSLFYPFAGPDISYPLLFFPDLEHYTLVGMEFSGNPEIFKKNFHLSNFKPQIEGFLRSGFFKTMNMSAQIHYEQGVIPMLVAQIGLLNGRVQKITNIYEPFRGIVIDFTHNQKSKQLHYFRANLNDSNNKLQFFEFMQKNNFLDNCMLKASSYKLHQIEFKHLRQFMLDNCQLILQDDTGMPIKYLQQQARELQLFGNYIRPYGDEFKPYYQKILAGLYQHQPTRTSLDFCFGYGCGKVEANILVAKTKNYSISQVEVIKPELKLD